MIELRRIVLVNWHLMARADLDLAGDAAILGKNAAGKSTIIDLIQAVMAGGSSRLHKFNRSAGEGTQRSERTLAGYCLGQLNDDTFLRDDARSYIALVFEDPDGRRPVTLGLAIEVMRGQPADIVGRFVADGARLDSAMLTDETDGVLRPADWRVVKRRLEQACNTSNGQLHTHEDGRTFIREYMRILFTNKLRGDPERFIRTFVVALSFTDMPSVEQFVKKHLLEPNPIKIDELRGSIERYQEIKKTIGSLEERLEALRSISLQIQEYITLQDKEATYRAIEKTALLREALSALFINLSDRRLKQAELSWAESELDRVREEIDREIQTQTAIRDQLAASGIQGQRNEVERQIKDLDRESAVVMERLNRRYLSAARAVELLRLRDRLAVINPGELIRTIGQVEEASRGVAPPEWPRDPVGMETMLAAVAEAARSGMEKAKQQRDEAISQKGEVERDIKRDSEQLEAARQGQVLLDQVTVRLMEALRREGMRPRTLCEAAEVVDENWRAAAESLLGRDRETVIVDPEHAYRATEILRRGRGDYPGCRVANTRKLQSRSNISESGTLASVINSDDPLVMAFVVFRVGNVRLAASQEELLSGGRAVMVDGAYHDGLVTEVRRAQGMKIGRAAAPLMIATLQQRITGHTDLLQVHRGKERFFDDVMRRLEQCAQPVADADRLESITTAYSDLAERRTEARDRLGRIAAQVDPRLTEAEARATRAIKSLNEDRDRLVFRRATLEAELKQLDEKLRGGNNQPGSWLALNHHRRQFKIEIHSVGHFQAVRKRYAEFASRSPRKIAEDMANRASQAREDYRELEHQIRAALGRYAMAFPDPLEGYAQALITGAVRTWVNDGIATLEGNELIRYRQLADEIADHVTLLFKTTFIHELNSRFGQMEVEMDRLAKALRSRPFNNETYSLKASIKQEFEDIYRLVRDSETDDSVLDALFGRAPPRDERHGRAILQVEQLLADDTFDFSVFQEYQNYFTYDLKISDAASNRTTSFDRRRGVASGAERQVPFYVVIGAALSVAYHGTRQSEDHIGMGMGLAVFDEAFSKMDGPNQRTLLDFYRDIGLQVVIAAPTEKRAVVYENLNYIIDIFRSGDVSMAESIKIKDRARREMRSANPQYVTNEELAARLSTESQAAE
ncbi:SbcC/MukB-like Walker B domain-containing protein [Rhizobium sp. CNPSo 4062]|uniref:SbcC/MukB-like Walker B domain-containing protein n=1 Tax=Rhizobium sp. CNPSo 4062 TaxID=3021410 RepID=UPI00254FC2CC|nr:SbcC/MukB-like Walker B domain-containing protein [Rhizobium sp. CNPSo 4062]MDK4705023.1 SbcC/MukB-like Walker B domain-containing protein [Rhizobium sp. CNPSo 4062]